MLVSFNLIHYLRRCETQVRWDGGGVLHISFLTVSVSSWFLTSDTRSRCWSVVSPRLKISAPQPSHPPSISWKYLAISVWWKFAINPTRSNYRLSQQLPERVSRQDIHANISLPFRCRCWKIQKCRRIPRNSNELFKWRRWRLRDKLRNAWVFHTTFENGTGLRSGEKGFQAIGTRMLYQPLPHKLFDDIISIIHSYQEPHPLAVLDLVAKYGNKRFYE